MLLAGVYLVATGPWTLAEPWVGSGLLIVGVLLVGVLAVLSPGERRAAELAERDLGAGGELSDEYWAVSRRVAMVGGFASLLVVIGDRADGAQAGLDVAGARDGEDSGGAGRNPAPCPPFKPAAPWSSPRPSCGRS